MTCINNTAIWAQLHQHQRTMCDVHMRDLFEQDPERFNKMHQTFNGLLFDYSKNRITEETINLLIKLAETAQIKTWIDKMYTGEKINCSEGRPVLHTALRQPETAKIYIDNRNIIPEIQAELEKSFNLAELIRQGSYLGFSHQPIINIVNIGIGGSDLGPKMLYAALKPYHHKNINVYYVSNIDAAHLSEILKNLMPENTLFIIVSKSFATTETLLNASVAKQWLLKQSKGKNIAKHFVAITSNRQTALDFGINSENILHVSDGVGGRYSVWSPISFSVMCAIGRHHFLEFLAGGRKMDEHFKSSPYAENIPVLMGLLGIWYNNFYHSSSHAIIPYDHSLRQFPSHIQQLDMESNGKRTSRNGEYLNFNTGVVTWGKEGVNCQHAFCQLLHQGTHLICSDFIVIANSFYPEHHQLHKVLVSNALAQTKALMHGKVAMEVDQELGHLPEIEHNTLAQQKFFPGNQPTNTIFLTQLTPFNLGMLLALYEHKVFVQGIIWGINSFDQWGVEYGKVLAKNIEPLLSNQQSPDYDSSTNHLINYFRQHHKCRGT